MTPNSRAEALPCQDCVGPGVVVCARCGNCPEHCDHFPTPAAPEAAILEELANIESIKMPKHSETFVAMNQDAIILAHALRSAEAELAEVSALHRELGADYLVRTKERDEARAQLAAAMAAL